MTYKSIAEIKKDILRKAQKATQDTLDEVHRIFDDFLKQYYAEYNPVMYERTYQLLESLVKVDARPTSLGYVGEIYFNLSALDYSMKTINGVTYNNKGWSEQKTLDAAAHGSHGGYTSGVAIYDEPIKILDAKAIDMLVSRLRQLGVNVK